MIVRKHILPRTIPDTLSLIFVMSIVPFLYWYQLWIVLPQVFESGSASYVFHFLLGNFFMVNIVGNFTFTVLCDTSTRQIIVPASDASVEKNWRFCAVCEALAPPRSWHCSTCDVCILKRDHHCIFVACCVGHRNHRYFFMFIFYVFVAALYCLCYESYFLWGKFRFDFPTSILKIVFPMAIFVFGIDGSNEQFYLMVYVVTVAGMLFTGALCVYHFNLIMNGTTAAEENKNNYAYDFGWSRNLREVFGDKWYLVWILPYIKSTLPGDGISWAVSRKHENTRKTK